MFDVYVKKYYLCGMEVKGLMIGNYIYYKGKLDRIGVVGSNCSYLEGYGNGADDKDITPIPLTEEWLLRFGWEKLLTAIGMFNETWINRFVKIEKTKSGDFLFKSIHIKYVHQLQNLYFALTGEELVLASAEGGGEK